MKPGANDIRKAMAAATRALAVKSLTRRELGERLVRRGHDAAIVGRVLDDLERLRLLSDRAAAESDAHARLRSGHSRSMMEAKLLDRGVPSATAREAVNHAIADSGPADLLALARKRAHAAPRTLPPDAIRRRVFAWLVRHGHDEEDSRDAAERAVDEIVRD